MATGTLVDVVMPQMGVSVSEGTITRWAKAGRRHDRGRRDDRRDLDRQGRHRDPLPGVGRRAGAARGRGRDRPGEHPHRGHRHGGGGGERSEATAEAIRERRTPARSTEPVRCRRRPARFPSPAAAAQAAAHHERRRAHVRQPRGRADGGRAQPRHRRDPRHRPRRPGHEEGRPAVHRARRARPGGAGAGRARGARRAPLRRRPHPRRPPHPRPRWPLPCGPRAGRRPRRGRPRRGALPLHHDPQGDRAAHAPLARDGGAGDDRHRGRHDRRRQPAQALEARVQTRYGVNLTYIPFVAPRDHRRDRPLAVGERRGERRDRPDQEVRQPGHGRGRRRLQGPDGAGDPRRRGEEPGRPRRGR